MTHRIEVNVETGEVTQVEYTPEEQVAHDAAVAAQQTVVTATPEPTLLEIIAQLQAKVAALEAK
jgi:urease accessory protein UreH